MIRTFFLGQTDSEVVQNECGCLPLQRNTVDEAVALLRRAFEGGMRFFDTARAYTDSEEKLGIAFKGIREQLYIATKSTAKTGEDLRRDL